MPAISPPERPEFDAEGVELAVFVAELAGRVCEEELEKLVKGDEDELVKEDEDELVKEDENVLVPRMVVEMIRGVPGFD
jgi:hypothetical protein